MRIFIVDEDEDEKGGNAAIGLGVIIGFIGLVLFALIYMLVIQVKFWCCNPNDIELSLYEDTEGADDEYQNDDDCFTTFCLKVKNKTALDIAAFTSTIKIYNASGEKLVEQTDRLNLPFFKKNEERIVRLYFTGLDSKKSKELYYSKIDALKVTFQFEKIEYSCGKAKEYKDFEPIVLLEPKLSVGSDGIGTISTTEKTYQEALSLYNQGKYAEAMVKFKDLGYYKESRSYYSECSQKIENSKQETKYQSAVTLMNSGKYVEAISAFTEILDYKDSCEKVYQSAKALMKKEKYREAIAAFADIHDYKDSEDKIQEAVEAGVAKAETLAASGKYKDAVNVLSQLEGCNYDKTLYEAYSLAGEGDYIGAAKCGIKVLTIPEGVTSIPEGFLYEYGYKFKLERIILPSTVRTIGNYAFFSCQSLTEINFPSGLTSIGDYAFPAGTLEGSITLPSTLETIGQSAFSGCIFTSITLPQGLREMGSFSGCRNLLSITVPGVNAIPDFAFSNCTSLKSVTISEGTESIGAYAFKGCGALMTVSLPSTLTTIKEEVFYNCKSLYEITIPASVNYIGQYSFYLSGLNKLYFQNDAGWKNNKVGSVDVTDYSTNATRLSSKINYYDATWTRS